MFLYQNRLLKAQILNGILESQQRMIDLYTVNLNAVGTQAALITGVTYLAINVCYIQPNIIDNWIAFSYNMCYAISASSSMIMVSHCILGSMLGPTKSLIGESSDAVQVAVRDMRKEQELGLLMGFICITCIFFGTAIQVWANYPPILAGILTTFYMIGFIVFAWTGHHTFKIFQLNYNISTYHLAKDRDLEADMGTLDDDMSRLTFQRGFSLLNTDIMELVDQVRPTYDRGEVIDAHNKKVSELFEAKKNQLFHLPSTTYPSAMDVIRLGVSSSAKLFPEILPPHHGSKLLPSPKKSSKR